MFKTLEMMKKRDERGFTLIELLIVIAIIAILAAIAIPQFSQYREKSVRATMISDARNTATMLEGVFADCQSYPSPSVAAGSSTSVTENFGSCPAGSTSTVKFNASKGNAIAVTGTATTYSIQVTNASGGSTWSPLTMTGGPGTATPSCTFTNGMTC